MFCLAKKGNAEGSCYVFCEWPIRFLGVRLFGLETGGILVSLFGDAPK